MIKFDLYEDEESAEDKALAEAGLSIASQIDKMILDQILSDISGKVIGDFNKPAESKIHTPQGVFTTPNGVTVSWCAGEGW